MNEASPWQKYSVFFAGLYVSSLGVALITKASLGTSPISSIPYVLSLGFKPTLGQFTIAFNLLLIGLQVHLGTGKLNKEHIAQLPITVVFGFLIDFALQNLSGFRPIHYYTELSVLMLGCFVLGLGVYLEVVAGVIMLPGESFVKVVSERTRLDFGTTKMICDASMAIIAVMVSLSLFKKISGVREGTLIAAFLVGLVAKHLNKLVAYATAR